MFNSKHIWGVEFCQSLACASSGRLMTGVLPSGAVVLVSCSQLCLDEGGSQLGHQKLHLVAVRAVTVLVHL
jgi:hypothetical protein